jgi:hypothetical protein
MRKSGIIKLKRKMLTAMTQRGALSLHSWSLAGRADGGGMSSHSTYRFHHCRVLSFVRPLGGNSKSLDGPVGKTTFDELDAALGFVNSTAGDAGKKVLLLIITACEDDGECCLRGCRRWWW